MITAAYAAETATSGGSAIGALIFVCVMIVGYFLPALIAGARHHHNAGAIFLTNLVFGWTFLGWIIALIWAFTNPVNVIIQGRR